MGGVSGWAVVLEGKDVENNSGRHRAVVGLKENNDRLAPVGRHSNSSITSSNGPDGHFPLVITASFTLTHPCEAGRAEMLPILRRKKWRFRPFPEITE